MTRPAVFLDRDGTVIEDVGYLSDAAGIELLPWSAAAIRRLNDAGRAVVVATNQSGVARGRFGEGQVAAIHAALDAALAVEGARIDAYYYCPHHPEGSDRRYAVACACRKPGPGMLQRAAADLVLDLPASWMVGDRWRDVQAGAAAGARTILIRSGREGGYDTAPPGAGQPDAILNNLMEAVEWILRSSSR